MFFCAFSQIFFNILSSLFICYIFLLLTHVVKYLCKLLTRIICEEDILIKSGFKTWIRINKLFHLVSITRNNNYQIISVILHQLEEGIHSFLSKILFISALYKSISFVYKKNSTDSTLNNLCSLSRSLSYVSSYKIGSINLYQLSFADNAKSFSDAMFVTVPVYDAEQTLTEAHSAVLLAGMDKNVLIQRLRGAFTGTTSAGAEYKEIDIRQMLLDAIPDKVEPSGHDLLSLTEAFYVRRVAEKLGANLEYKLSDEDLLEKVYSCQNADGGFGWFEGMKSSPIITAVVLERLAKLRDAGLEAGDINSDKAVAFLDKNQFIHDSWPYWCGWLSTAQYAHVRSMYTQVPFDVSKETLSEMSEYSKNFKEFKKYIKDYLVPSAKDGRGLQGQILAKARRIKTLVNLVYGEDGLKLASAWGIKFSADQKMRNSIIADIASLDEYAVEHRDGGWYYPNAVMPWRGLLESELYAHSLLCDLLSDKRVASQSEVEAKIADGIRIWTMLQKETQKWGDDPAFVDAINSVMTGGEDVLSTRVILMSKTYRKPFSQIVAAGNGFTVERHFFKEVHGAGEDMNLVEIYPGMKLQRGDKIVCEYKIWNQENRSFVKLTAPREAAFRPVNQLSGHVGWWYRPIGSYAISPQGYRNVKTDRTEYFFDVYPEEHTTVTEEFFITQEGTFSAPVVTIESLYAPHYRANDKFGGVLTVVQ